MLVALVGGMMVYLGTDSMVVVCVFVVAVIGVVAAAVVDTAARPAVAPSFLLPSRSAMALDWAHWGNT